MNDHFALLGEPRRPWLDAEELKRKFLARSAEVHPDRFHNASEAEIQSTTARYQEFNTAYHCLREPKERLRHLLELELNARPVNIQQVPAAMLDLFFETGQLCKAVDAFLAEKAQATSPLLKVKFLERGLDWMDKLNAAQQKLRGQASALDAELKAMNPLWDSVEKNPDQRTRLPLLRLEEIYRTLSFLSRWSAQLQERVVQLTI